MEKQVIHLGTDHAGFAHKEILKEYLIGKGYEVIDHGAGSYVDGDDYPEFIARAARAVSENQGQIAVVFGGSGTGEAIVANRFPGVRAVVANGNPRDIITLSREHNNANALSIGARFVAESELCELVQLWIDTPFSSDERHMRRIAQIEDVR